MYPTRASSRPFVPKCFLYRCSTPQKQPAATVAFCAPSGTDMGGAGAVLILKDRIMRFRKDIEV